MVTTILAPKGLRTVQSHIERGMSGIFLGEGPWWSRLAGRCRVLRVRGHCSWNAPPLLLLTLAQRPETSQCRTAWGVGSGEGGGPSFPRARGRGHSRSARGPDRSPGQKLSNRKTQWLVLDAGFRCYKMIPNHLFLFLKTWFLEVLAG